jgi:hypothetical protein
MLFCGLRNNGKIVEYVFLSIDKLSRKLYNFTKNLSIISKNNTQLRYRKMRKSINSLKIMKNGWQQVFELSIRKYFMGKV